MVTMPFHKILPTAASSLMGNMRPCPAPTKVKTHKIAPWEQPSP